MALGWQEALRFPDRALPRPGERPPRKRCADAAQGVRPPARPSRGLPCIGAIHESDSDWNTYCSGRQHMTPAAHPPGFLHEIQSSLAGARRCRRRLVRHPRVPGTQAPPRSPADPRAGRRRFGRAAHRRRRHPARPERLAVARRAGDGLDLGPRRLRRARLDRRLAPPRERLHPRRLGAAKSWAASFDAAPAERAAPRSRRGSSELVRTNTYDPAHRHAHPRRARARGRSRPTRPTTPTSSPRAATRTPSRRARSPTRQARASWRRSSSGRAGRVDQPARRHRHLHAELAARAARRQRAHRRQPWSGPGVSIVVLLAGIGAHGLVPRRGSARTSRPRAPASDPLAQLGRRRPSQRATLKYFAVAAALILAQIGVGMITAHYGVEGAVVLRHPARRVAARTRSRAPGTPSSASSGSPPRGWPTGLYVAPAIGRREPQLPARSA